jgi:hypothetical protein
MTILLDKIRLLDYKLANKGHSKLQTCVYFVGLCWLVFETPPQLNSRYTIVIKITVQ